MSKKLTCQTLIDLLQKTLEKHGNVPIYFDTEAREYEYHLAKVGSAYFNDIIEPHISLHEEN